jgi:hypothetical protein
MKDKALIKKTGEILDVESKYTINHMSFTFEYDLGDIFHTSSIMDENELETTFVHNSNQQEEGEYFLLSDGKTYHEKYVIVGLDIIRDEKMKDILG